MCVSLLVINCCVLCLLFQMIDAGHFWAQLSDAVALSNLAAMVVAIEMAQLVPLSRPEEQHIGSYCLASFSIDKKYYRARIENISEGSAHVMQLHIKNVIFTYQLLGCFC